jgi:glucose-6-phosphate 1-dehydrogenase
VAADFDTETLIALRCEIDNWRWAGVPFFLRTGKQSAEVRLRKPPKAMFSHGSGARAQHPTS